MAIELESSGMSPRISFSHDFCQSDLIIPVEQRQHHPLRSNSTGIDFDFCVRKSFGQESSSADELFSDGKILPTQVKKKHNNSTPQALVSLQPPAVSEDAKTDQEVSLKRSSSKSSSSNSSAVMVRDESGDDHSLEAEKQSSNKSFWKFKRSSSLNCGSGYGRSLCPLPLLSRSNSTGSAHKDNHNHKENPHKSASIRSSSSSNYLKPPLKKSGYGAYGNGTIHVNPVLNVPSGNLFGLGSILFNGKDKNKKK